MMSKIDFVQEPLTISSNEVLELATETLKEYFNLLVNGHKYTDEIIFHILVKASAETSPIEDTCNQLEDAPYPNAIRYQLKKNLLIDIKTLEEQANRALFKHLPPKIKSKRQEIAIDLVFIPYHGEAYESDNEIRRSQAKSGTTHFHCYATSYIIKKNKRVTLALTYVHANDNLVEVLERLFTYLAEIGISLRRLYLDKAFYQVPVIRFF
jgi:putative transposase